MSLPINYCDSDASVQAAAETLSGASLIVLDCEGVDLGRPGGSLSIITLCGVETDSSTYIIDVSALDKLSLKPVLALLTNESIPKVVFDGRRDAIALSEHCDVEIAGDVLDLQLGDVSWRSDIARETQSDQLARLRAYVPEGEISSSAKLYWKIHKLSNLNAVISEHNVEVKGKVSKESMYLSRPTSPF